jgi:hypothetical protein
VTLIGKLAREVREELAGGGCIGVEELVDEY